MPLAPGFNYDFLVTPLLMKRKFAFFCAIILSSTGLTSSLSAQFVTLTPLSFGSNHAAFPKR